MMQLIEKLKEELLGRNYSQRTVANYCSIVGEFYQWIDKNNRELNPDSLKSWCLSLKQKYQTATVKLKICSLRYFVINILNKPEYIQYLPTIRQESKLPIVLSKKEVKSLIGAALNETHKMILTILYVCGLRLTEILSIKIGDIDFDRKTILIHGKSKRDRFVPVDDRTIALIKKTISDLDYNDYLCTTIRKGPLDRSGRKMAPRTIGAIVKNCARRAGIKKRIYPHLLRHSIATHLIEDGVDIRYVQILLGHVNILCTSHYTHIAKMPNDIMTCKTSYLFD